MATFLLFLVLMVLSGVSLSVVLGDILLVFTAAFVIGILISFVTLIWNMLIEIGKIPGEIRTYIRNAPIRRQQRLDDEAFADDLRRQRAGLPPNDGYDQQRAFLKTLNFTARSSATSLSPGD